MAGTRPKLPAILRWLTAVDAFVAVTAIAGGVALITDPSGGRLGMPLSLLEHSPFESFFVPGVLLAVVVGGSSLLAAVAHLVRARIAGQASFLAGLVLIGWIVSQVALLRGFHWLHGAYLAVGVLQLVLVIRALGRAKR